MAALAKTDRLLRVESSHMGASASGQLETFGSDPKIPRKQSLALAAQELAEGVAWLAINLEGVSEVLALRSKWSEQKKELGQPTKYYDSTYYDTAMRHRSFTRSGSSPTLGEQGAQMTRLMGTFIAGRAALGLGNDANETMGAGLRCAPGATLIFEAAGARLLV